MKGITTLIIPILIAAALIFSISIIPMSLVQAQAGLNQNQTQGNRTSNNNSSIPIAPGALIYPSYKPCKDNPGVLCSVPPKPPKPIPPNMTILPPPLQPGAKIIPLRPGELPPGISPQDKAYFEANMQYFMRVANEFVHRLDGDNSIAHQAHVLKQMTAEGLIDCPAPFTNPGTFVAQNCIFASPVKPPLIK
ncbi:MAG: hypothetical protein ACTHKP_12505 [Nitrososphaeraceae archaeon]